MTLLDPAPPAPQDGRAPYWLRLGERGDWPALVTGADGVTLTYAELDSRVTDLVGRLGSRRLVLLEAHNDVDTVVGLLACLVGGHPVLLTEPGSTDTLTGAYDPDTVLRGGDLTVRRETSAHDLHPDLALLLSTSGSTGSPKLVRLSHTNLTSNAESIALSLGIRPGDLAATTLPLHYCYGLSVLTSHLSVGAAVLLTDLSVVDPCFWDLVARHGVTTFPGVPHTFDLLDRAGFADRDLPSLRYLTCAGGRLPAESVRRFAELGRRRGFDLVVMYGATEATARMAYLPPDQALDHPGLLGRPVEGGSFSLRPVDPTLLHGRELAGAEQAGELVYRGDNVMLGYAHSPADLARGREVQELRTGDLARRTPEGLEIIGRASRIAKVFGLRLDLDRVERALLDAGVAARAVDGGDRVVVAVDTSAAPVSDAAATRIEATLANLGPRGAFQVLATPLPRLSSGKPDYRALREQADRAREGATGGETRGGTAAVAAVFSRVLGRPAGPTDTFVGLGGDSLSYVEASLRLERVLGSLPSGWHLRTVAELAGTPATQRRRAAGSVMETNVLLRALAIVAIVGSHSNLFMVLGGAHLLVGLAGYNFARFQLTDRPRRERTRSLTRSITRVVVPSVAWLTFAAATSTKYGWENVLLLNGVLGTREWSEAWHYWFIEALVWTLVALTALLAVPAVDRAERRWPFWLPMGLAGAALLTRYDVVRLFDGDYIHRAHVLFWLFALGWAAAKATRAWQRLLVTAAVALTVPGFFEGDQVQREAVIVVGLALLVWLPTVRMPALLGGVVGRVVGRVAGVLASASLYIYLCHWQIYPAYEFSLPWLATALSLAAGITFWWVVSHATPGVERAFGEIRENRRWLSLRRCSRRDEPTAPVPGPGR